MGFDSEARAGHCGPKEEDLGRDPEAAPYSATIWTNGNF